jgi:hypothetical protein
MSDAADCLLSLREVLAWAQAMFEVHGDFEQLTPSVQTLLAAVVETEARRHLESGVEPEVALTR